MSQISYARHCFPSEIIQHSVWLYYRFSLSLRDVEDLLAERGIDVSYETVRRWTHKYDPAYAKRIRLRRSPPSGLWHLDQVFVRIGTNIHCLWRAVEDESEVLDVLIHFKRDRKAALKLMRKLLRRQGFVPDAIITHRLRSYGTAPRELGLSKRHELGGRLNNRADVSHQPARQRERQHRKFRSPGSAQKFLSTHAAVYNQFNFQHHLISRRTMKAFRTGAFANWRDVVAS